VISACHAVVLTKAGDLCGKRSRQRGVLKLVRCPRSLAPTLVTDASPARTLLCRDVPRAPFFFLLTSYFLRESATHRDLSAVGQFVFALALNSQPSTLNFLQSAIYPDESHNKIRVIVRAYDAQEKAKSSSPFKRRHRRVDPYLQARDGEMQLPIFSSSQASENLLADIFPV
jgi:hypothetical protein